MQRPHQSLHRVCTKHAAPACRLAKDSWCSTTQVSFAKPWWFDLEPAANHRRSVVNGFVC